MTTEAKRTANPTHNAPEFRHPSEMDWEMGRALDRCSGFADCWE